MIRKIGLDRLILSAPKDPASRRCCDLMPKPVTFGRKPHHRHRHAGITIAIPAKSSRYDGGIAIPAEVMDEGSFLGTVR